MFSAPTYIVLDLPPTVGGEVIELRKRFDEYEANLPPEITLSGSSGIGVLCANQDAELVLKAVERVGRKYLPFSTSFVSMERFLGVSIYWLKPKDREPFDTLQMALIAEGIRFESSPFPFNPHCTISATVDLTEEQEHELLNIAIPRQEFVMNTIGVYQLVEGVAVPMRSFCFPP